MTVAVVEYTKWRYKPRQIPGWWFSFRRGGQYFPADMSPWLPREQPLKQFFGFKILGVVTIVGHEFLFRSPDPIDPTSLRWSNGDPFVPPV